MKNQKPFNLFIKNGHNIVLILASILFIGSLFYSAYFINNTKQAEAQGSGEYLSGWAWSDNFGWVSFDCNDNSSCGAVNYRVDVANNGDLSGYAWGDNIGWITFNESDLSQCPSGACKAKLSGNNLQGWARALSNGDSWDGWISLNGSNYGITLNSNDEFTGYAWDASDIEGDAIGSGWIDFDPPFGGVVYNSSSFECSDGVDNADPEDTKVDTNDAGCYDTGAYDTNDDDETDTLPQCSNFFDDDGDGFIDYPNDPGCESVDDISEVDPALPQCSDGVDNDNDGVLDSNDPDCYGSGVGGGYNSGDNNESGSAGGSQCSDGIDNDGDGNTDYPNDGGCSDAFDNDESGNGIASSFECSDGVDNADPEDTKVDTNDPGCYDTGAYDANDNDETDTLPQCSNFFDDDGDGFIDYPNDTGCSSPSDDREQNFSFEEF